MGGSGSKQKLSKEDLDFLMENTNFTKKQIKAWYSGFMVNNALLTYLLIYGVCVFTCVGWQVSLCDPIWQATSRIAVKWSSINSYTLPLPSFTFYSA